MKWIGASTELVMDHPVESVWEFVSNIENFRDDGQTVSRSRDGRRRESVESGRHMRASTHTPVRPMRWSTR